MNWGLDHVVISAENLADGAVFVEELLGAPLEVGGVHPHMGTHNRVMSLGPNCYLEVIAIDPAAKAPTNARWFDLDNFSGPPRLTNWVMRVDNLKLALANIPKDIGDIVELERGDLRWKMVIPRDGKLPFEGVFPGLIEWHGLAHPAKNLPDRGLRLETLEIESPHIDELAKSLKPLSGTTNLRLSHAGGSKLAATISGSISGSTEPVVVQ